MSINVVCHTLLQQFLKKYILCGMQPGTNVFKSKIKSAAATSVQQCRSRNANTNVNSWPFVMLLALGTGSAPPGTVCPSVTSSVSESCSKLKNNSKLLLFHTLSAVVQPMGRRGGAQGLTQDRHKMSSEGTWDAYKKRKKCR